MTYDMDISPDVLEGGHWALDPKTRVMRWVEDVPESPAEVVACSYCGALATEVCRTSSGASRKNHPVRTIPRTCLCGAALRPKAMFCQHCAYERDLVNKREHYRRNKSGNDQLWATVEACYGEAS